MSEDTAVSADRLARAKSILVVEDNVSLRFTLAEWMRVQGYIVYEGATADEAVEILNSPIHVDLVVTDVDMPGTMDGIGLTEHIQATASGMEVIIVSGKPNERIKEKGVKFFLKPYDFEALGLHIDRVLPKEPVGGPK